MFDYEGNYKVLVVSTETWGDHWTVINNWNNKVSYFLEYRVSNIIMEVCCLKEVWKNMRTLTFRINSLKQQIYFFANKNVYMNYVNSTRSLFL